MIPYPPPEVIWTTLFAALAAVVGFTLTATIDAWRTRQRLEDHVDECHRRAIDNGERLRRVEDKLDRLLSGQRVS